MNFKILNLRFFSFFTKNNVFILQNGKGGCLNRGVTIVELMVVLSIVLILSVFVVANYRQSNKSLVLELEINRLAQNLRKAQNWALSAHQVAGVPTVTGYGVYVKRSESDTSYKIYIDTDNNQMYNGAPDHVLEVMVLDKQVEIALTTPDSLSVNFVPPNPTTKITDGDYPLINYDTALIQFDLKSDSSVFRVVRINKSGLIYAE